MKTTQKMSDIRILHISTHQIGGAALAALRLHNALLKSSVNSRFLTLEGNSNRENQIYVYRPLLDFRKNHGLSKIIKSLLYRTNLFMGRWWRMHDKARSNGHNCHYTYPVSPYRVEQHPLVRWADVIHLHFCDDFINYPTFFKKVKKPIVWTIHDKGFVYGGFHYKIYFDRYNTYYREIEQQFINIKKQSISCAKRLSLISLSDDMSTLISKTDYLGNRPVIKIYNCVDYNIFKPYDKNLCRIELNLPANKTILLFIAEYIYDERKGFPVLLQSIKEMGKNNIIICAVGNYDTNSISEQREDVIYLGKISDSTMLSKLISASDFLVAPSYDESFGLTPIEAMACGTPVVAFPTGAMKDYIHSEHGVVCKECTVQALKEGIAKAMNTTYDGAVLRQYVSDNFSPEVIAKKYIDVYNKTLTNNS